jgi:hypothetical protein
MISAFLFYNDEHQLDLNRVMDKLNNDITEIGAKLRIEHLEDI